MDAALADYKWRANSVAARPQKRFLLATEVDRSALSEGPLAPFLEFVSPWAPLPVVDALPLAIVVVSEAGFESVETLQSRLLRLRTVPPPSVLRLAGGAGAEAELLARLLDGPLGRLANYASRVNAELLDVRREREELFENFRALEDAFSAQSLASVACVFEHAPYADPHDRGFGDWPSGGVTQRLPVASAGVAGFALHFRDPRAAEAPVRIALAVAETETVVGEWLAGPEDLTPGWSYFALPRALPQRARTLALTLRAEGERPPEPSLGFFLAQPEFAASAAPEQPELERRPLAFRVYAGVPGVRPDGGLALVAATPASGEPVSLAFRLPERALASVELCSPAAPHLDFELATYLADEKAVVCHPHHGGPTVAALRGALPRGALWAQARARIAHPLGRPALAAMFVVEPSASPVARAAALAVAEAGRPRPGFTGWLKVASGGDEVSLHLQLPPDFSGGDLYLASLPADGEVDFSWLRFTEFRVARRFHS